MIDKCSCLKIRIQIDLLEARKKLKENYLGFILVEKGTRRKLCLQGFLLVIMIWAAMEMLEIL